MTKQQFLNGSSFYMQDVFCDVGYDKFNQCLVYYGDDNWNCFAFKIAFIGRNWFAIYIKVTGSGVLYKYFNYADCIH